MALRQGVQDSNARGAALAEPFSGCSMRLSGLLSLVRPRRPGTRPALGVELRIGDQMFAQIREHVEDSRDGEQGAFILCGHARADDTDVLLAREWERIPRVRSG